MRTMRSKGVVILFLLAAMILFATNQSWALVGSNTGGGGTFFDGLLTPKAKGTKVTGTIAIYWHPNGVGGTCADDGSPGEMNDVVYFFSVDEKPQKPDDVPYLGIVTGICAGDLNTLQGSIYALISQTIIPDAVPSATNWWFKSYSNLVTPSLSDPNSWLMLNFVFVAK